MGQDITEDAPRDEDIRSFERLARWRRDVRRFRRDAVPECAVRDILDMTRFAPSVGLSEPWRFMRVDSAAARISVRANFREAQAQALSGYQGERARLYASLKLAGLEEAPVQIAVFCDRTTGKGHGLGTATMPETLVYSTVCAIMLIWLAAAARGLGLGWLSILDPERLARDLEAPPDWLFVAYLCIGWPERPSLEPELEAAGWEQRALHGPIVLAR